MSYKHQGEESFLKGNLSRNSSVGYSSHILYHRKAEGMPFKWERQPGTPKNPPPQEIIPPISPPPAILSLSFPKPTIIERKKPHPISQRLKFWSKIKLKRSQSKRVISQEGCHHVSNDDNYLNASSNEFDVFEFCSSDCEYMASSPYHSRSSSSFSLCLSNGSNGRDSFEKRLGCTPWSVNSILVGIARRIR